MQLEYGNFEETVTARRGSNLVVRFTPTRNAEAREKNVNILQRLVRLELLRDDPDKDGERNVSEFASAVDALAILKNVYGKPVGEEDRGRLEKLKGYDFVGPRRGESDRKEWARLEPVINDLLKSP